MVIKTIDDLQIYLKGVAERTEHAPKVREVISTLITAVIIAKDEDTDLHTYGNNTGGANVLYFFFEGTKYCFRYCHETGNIELLKGSLRGDCIQMFNEKWTVDKIIAYFSNRFNIEWG